MRHLAAFKMPPEHLACTVFSSPALMGERGGGKLKQEPKPHLPMPQVRGVIALCLILLLAPLTSGNLPRTDSNDGAWQRDDSPDSPDGMALAVWQPSIPAVLWDVEWSPNGTHIAAVGLDGSLSVWNHDDGRVVMRLNHNMQLIGVDWLDDEHVITLDQRHNWNLYTMHDDGSPRPSDSIEHRSGHWSSNMRGV